MRRRTDRARSAGHDGRRQRDSVTVRYDELSSALDFVSVGGLVAHEAYISLDRGAIVWISGDDLSDDTVPDDLETSRTRAI